MVYEDQILSTVFIQLERWIIHNFSVAKTNVNY